MTQSISRQRRRANERAFKKGIAQRYGKRVYPNRVFYWAHGELFRPDGGTVPLNWATAHFYETCERLAREWAGWGGRRPVQVSYTAAQERTTGLCPLCHYRWRMGG